MDLKPTFYLLNVTRHLYEIKVHMGHLLKHTSASVTDKQLDRRRTDRDRGVIPIVQPLYTHDTETIPFKFNSEHPYLMI